MIKQKGLDTKRNFKKKIKERVVIWIKWLLTTLQFSRVSNLVLRTEN